MLSYAAGRAPGLKSCLLCATMLAALAPGAVALAQAPSAPATPPAAQPQPTSPAAAPTGQDAAAQAGAAQVAPIPTAPAQSAGAPVAEAPAGGATVKEVVVTGYRRSLADAANAKRMSTNFTDSIFAEDIGKFPDLNIAESLQRIPGVQLTRDVTGEGVQVSVRGLGPSFTKVTLNGAQIAVASDGGLDTGSSNREVDLDLFPTELFTKLTVSKTPTADLIEGGIAGNVNLANARPFDNPGQHVNFSYEEGYGESGNRGSPRGSLIASKTWGDTFGVLVGVAGAALNYRVDGYETIGFTTANMTTPPVGNCTVATCDTVGNGPGGQGGGAGFKFPTTVPPGTAGMTAGSPLNVAQTSGLSNQQLSNALVPRLPRYAYDQGARDRVSVLFSTEYRPNDKLKFALDALWGAADRHFNRLDQDLIVRNAGTGTTPGFVPENWQVDSNGVLTQGTFSNAQFLYEARPYQENLDFYNFNPTFSYKPVDWFELDGQLDYNKSTFFRHDWSFIYDTPPNSGLVVNYDNTGNRPFPIITASQNQNNPNLGFVNDTSGYRIQDTKRVTIDQGAHFDATIGDKVTNIKFGYAYDDTGREIVNYDNSAAAQAQGTAAVPNGAIGQYLAPGPKNLLGQSGIPAGFNFVQPIYGALEKAVNTAQLDATAPYTLVGAQGGVPSGDLEERTQGTYIELNGVTDFFTRHIHYNAGIRYFHTDQRIVGPVQAGSQVIFQTDKTSYDGYLPSFNAAIDLTDKLILRLAGSRTMTRAAPDSLLPGVTFTDPAAQVATQGNPNLKPYFSNNADIGLEYYTGGPGYISLNLFNKDIDGFTQTIQVREPFSALGLPLSALTAQQLGTGIGNDTLINVNTQENVGQTLNIQGEEIIYQQPLDVVTRRLPFQITGFGFTGNYTHVEQHSQGSGAVASGIAPNLYTLGGYFENFGLSVHIDYTWTEHAITAIAPQNNVNLPIVQDDHGQLDLSSSYVLPWYNKAFQITFNAINITNEPLRSYFGYKNATYSIYYPGPQYLLGVRAHF